MVDVLLYQKRMLFSYKTIGMSMITEKLVRGVLLTFCNVSSKSETRGPENQLLVWTKVRQELLQNLAQQNVDQK